MNQTNYGDCTNCGGQVSPRVIQKVCSRNNRLVAVISGVPAGVCDQCGARYDKAGVVKRLRRQLAALNPATNKIEVPNLAYAA
jgi:YgiT-type zinc finger domain-containing protein